MPKEARDALDVGPGDKLTWEVNGSRVAVTTERPAFWRWAGSVKGGLDDPVQAVAQSRKRRGRI